MDYYFKYQKTCFINYFQFPSFQYPSVNAKLCPFTATHLLILGSYRHAPNFQFFFILKSDLHILLEQMKRCHYDLLSNIYLNAIVVNDEKNCVPLPSLLAINTMPTITRNNCWQQKSVTWEDKEWTSFILKETNVREKSVLWIANLKEQFLYKTYTKMLKWSWPQKNKCQVYRYR